MPQDRPDYTPHTEIIDPEDIWGIARSMGLAELAVRLGSIVTFDRRGDVVWFDDFEDNINKWHVGTDGTPGEISLSTDTARNGAKSAKLISPSTNGYSTYMNKYLPLLIATNTGFEFSWAEGSDLDRFYITLTFRQAAYEYRFRIKYNVSQERIEYYNSDGDWVILHPRIWARTWLYHWNTWKIVVDYENLKWKRILANEFTFDMEGIAPYVGTGGLPHFTAASITAVSGAAGSKTLYVDDAIITQKEP
jgi:hypothetical protein